MTLFAVQRLVILTNIAVKIVVILTFARSIDSFYEGQADVHPL